LLLSFSGAAGEFVVVVVIVVVIGCLVFRPTKNVFDYDYDNRSVALH
jgi:hypothetical protein